VFGGKGPVLVLVEVLLRATKDAAAILNPKERLSNKEQQKKQD
jgi:hypothetical protein